MPTVSPHARARLADVVVLAAVAAFAAQDVFLPSHPPLLLALADTALVAPLVVRRQHPVAVFWTVLATAVALAPWDYKLTGSIALVVALYSVASRARDRDVVAAVAGLTVALFVASLLVGANIWSTFLSLSALTALTTVFGLWVRARRELVRRLREDADRLRRERDQRAELAAAAERARIARELHDIVAHHLTVMVALSDGAARAWAASGRAAGDSRADDALDAVREVAATGRRALADTRTLLGVLRDDEDRSTPAAPQPGLADLQRLVDVTRRAGLDVVLDVALDDRESPTRPGGVPAGVELTAYRIVQEGLTNALRHAGPGAHVTVGLTMEAAHLTVEVLDRGAGQGAEQAAQEQLRRRDGRGLAGLRERVVASGGLLDAGPLSPRGWQLRARLPLAGTREAA